MFVINSDCSIHLTRGDIAIIEVSAVTNDDDAYVFKANDVVRFKVHEKNHPEETVIEKDVVVETESPTVTVHLGRDDTKIGELINKPKDYWYEIELNPETMPQTIIGYDTDGPKVFRLYPEGED